MRVYTAVYDVAIVHLPALGWYCIKMAEEI